MREPRTHLHILCICPYISFVDAMLIAMIEAVVASDEADL